MICSVAGHVRGAVSGGPSGRNYSNMPSTELNRDVRHIAESSSRCNYYSGVHDGHRWFPRCRLASGVPSVQRKSRPRWPYLAAVPRWLPEVQRSS